MYYLHSQYYDPAICRFINADSYASTGQGYVGYNTFVYCNNNPVNYIDSTGSFWDTVFDLISLGSSVAEVCVNPTDFWAWAGLAGDLVDVAVPFVSGLGEATKAVGAVADVADVIDDVHDAARVADNVGGTYDAVKASNGLDNISDGVCFVEGTMICTADGLRAIEAIRRGDVVWAWNEETGETELKPVVETYVNETDELIHVFVEGEEIICTPSHPFYSPVKGWTDACKLRAGDILVLVNGKYVVIEKIQHEILESPIKVYNFQVEDDHAYYVSDAGVLVHNRCDVDISTGRTTPRNLEEKLAMESAKSNPSAGRMIISELSDPRFPADYSKFSQHFKTIRGEIEIHYVGNIARKVFTDFKFKS